MHAEVEKAAADCERRFGLERLLAGIDGELAARFRRQVERYENASRREAVEVQGPAMLRAYAAIEAAAEKYGVAPLSVSARAAAEMIRRHWPGASVAYDGPARPRRPIEPPAGVGQRESAYRRQRPRERV